MKVTRARGLSPALKLQRSCVCVCVGWLFWNAFGSKENGERRVPVNVRGERAARSGAGSENNCETLRWVTERSEEGRYGDYLLPSRMQGNSSGKFTFYTPPPLQVHVGCAASVAIAAGPTCSNDVD